MSGGDRERLTRKQESLIAALLVRSTIGEAAADVGISSATARRWRQQPEFQKAFREARAEVVAEARSRVRRLMVKAAERLEKIMLNPKTPLALQAKIAAQLYQFGVDDDFDENVLSRIEALENEIQSEGR